MILGKYYHKKTFFAFLLLEGIDDVDTLHGLLKAFPELLGIHPPTIFELRRVGEGPWWGCSLLKFMLHPADAHGNGWTDLDKTTSEQLRPEPYHLGRR